MRISEPLFFPLLLLTLCAGPAAAQTTAGYAAGTADRTSFEAWFSGLTGDYRTGADYWAGHRSNPKEAVCNGSGEQLQGCLAARQRLSPIDVRRKAEPDYRLGWNGVQSLAPPAQQPAPEALYHVQHDTYGCVNPRAALALTNPADPRRSDPGWVNYVVNDGTCAPITPNSPWRLIRHDGDLALMSYAGTTGRPGTFYLRESDLAAPVVTAAAPASQPASPSQPLQTSRSVDVSAGQTFPSPPVVSPDTPPEPNTNHQASRPPPANAGYSSPPTPPTTPAARSAFDPGMQAPASSSYAARPSESESGYGLTIFLAFIAIAIIGLVMRSNAERKRTEAAAARRRRANATASAEINAKAHLLHVKREQLTQPDYYGTRDYKAWDKEKERFIETRVIPLLNEAGMGDLVAELLPVIYAEVDAAAYRPIEPATLKTFSNPQVYGPDMDPVHYEMYCALQLRTAGWVTRATPTTGDQGADVLAERNGLTLVVQCKLYSNNVGNSAVQEAVAARMFHRTALALVVSNAAFTKSARELAGMSNVALLHHSQLPAYTGQSGPAEVIEATG